MVMDICEHFLRQYNHFIITFICFCNATLCSHQMSWLSKVLKSSGWIYKLDPKFDATRIPHEIWLLIFDFICQKYTQKGRSHRITAEWKSWRLVCKSFSILFVENRFWAMKSVENLFFNGGNEYHDEEIEEHCQVHYDKTVKWFEMIPTIEFVRATYMTNVKNWDQQISDLDSEIDQLQKHKEELLEKCQKELKQVNTMCEDIEKFAKKHCIDYHPICFDDYLPPRFCKRKK